MHPYEVMLMLDADADEARQNEVIARMRQIVEQGGGTFETVDAWGRLKLAYEIDHKGEAFYHIVNFTSSTETLVANQWTTARFDTRCARVRGHEIERGDRIGHVDDVGWCCEQCARPGQGALL